MKTTHTRLSHHTPVPGLTGYRSQWHHRTPGIRRQPPSVLTQSALREVHAAANEFLRRRNNLPKFNTSPPACVPKMPDVPDARCPLFFKRAS